MLIEPYSTTLRGSLWIKATLSQSDTPVPRARIPCYHLSLVPNMSLSLLLAGSD